METKYVDYTDNLFKKAVDNRKPRVYVFDNYNDKAEAKNFYQKPLLEQRSLFLTLDELKEKLFLTDKVVLKEEKLVLIFYEVLTNEDKELLEIDNYFNVIELANDFLDFYDQLNEYDVNKINNLADWQQRKYEIFQSIRARYKETMAQKGYTDRTLANNFTNFNLQFINNYSQLTAVNILDFTPLEKKMLAEIEAAGKEITLYYQLAKCDFDEENLTLKSVTLPDNLQPEVEIYETSDKFLEIINFLTQLEEKEADYEVLDADVSNSDYDKLLSTKRLNFNKEFSFTASKLYRFLEGLYTLLASSGKTQGKLKLNLAKLREVSCRPVIKDYYGIKKESISSLNELAQWGYVYFTQELITLKDKTDHLQLFSQIIKDIKKISQFKSLAQFIDWLSNLNLKALAAKKFKNDIAKYFESLSEINVISKLEIINSWHNYFDNQAQGLFNLILRYLRFKKLTADIPKADSSIKINDLLTAGCKVRDNLILLNISDGMIPTAYQTNFLLTKEQRRDLGLQSFAEKRLIEEYKFFQSILGAKKVIIFTLKNEEKNITFSSFLERLMLKYDLAVREVPIGEKDYNLIMQELFSSSETGGSEVSLPKLELPLAADDFKANLSLNYYKYRTLKECYCKFYFKHLVGLDSEWEEIDKKLAKKTLGNIAHNIFEAVVSDIKAKIKAGDFEVSEETAGEIVKQELINQELKIPKYYEKYYQKVLFPTVKEAVIDFLNKLKYKLTGEILNVLIEWEPEKSAFMTHKRADILLSGRVDLAVETTEQAYLIDYKTGKGSEEQLDFYSLLFDLEKPPKRSIYDVMEQKFTQSKTDSAVEFRKELKENLTNFLDSKEYEQATNSNCNYCQYQAICKVVGK